MSIERDGFLSPDLTDWVAGHRKANASWFAFLYKLNRFAQGRLLAVTVDGGDEQGRLIAALYARGLTNIQSAILLLERGSLSGCLILARSCFEDVFYIGAVRSSPTYHKNLHQRDEIAKSKLARVLLSPEGKAPRLSAEDQERLNRFRKSLLRTSRQKKSVSIEKVAQDAGLSGLYKIYRGLSNDPAHPSITALERHLDWQQNKFCWGPEHGKPDIFNIICLVLWHLVRQYDDQFGNVGNQSSSELERQYDELLESTNLGPPL